MAEELESLLPLTDNQRERFELELRALEAGCSPWDQEILETEQSERSEAQAAREIRAANTEKRKERFQHIAEASVIVMAGALVLNKIARTNRDQ